MALKKILLSAVMLNVLCAAPAWASRPSLEEYYLRHQVPVQYEPPAVAPSAVPSQPEAPVSGSSVVTSVSKCYDDLGADESAEIKRNSLTPYADCQKRLRERALEKKAAQKEPVAETPRNYKRVSDDGDADTPEADSPAQKSPTAKPAKKK